VRFSEEKIAQGAALTNKLFNASRFVLLNVRDVEPALCPTTVEDRWIASRLSRARERFEAQIAVFDFSKAALGLYDFVYGELCDWYLELIKGREFDDELSAHLRWVLRETLLLAHPVIPFVTEELWALAGGEGLLAAAQIGDLPARDLRAEEDIARVIAVVQAVRSWRNESGVAPGAVLEARLPGLEELAPLVAPLAHLTPVDRDGDAIATIPAGGVQVELLSGVDRAELEAKRAKERERLDAEIRRAEGKLANEGFVAKAPEALVQAERDKLEQLRAQRDAL
jgi:valyl-tRNA synthetase